MVTTNKKLIYFILILGISLIGYQSYKRVKKTTNLRNWINANNILLGNEHSELINKSPSLIKDSIKKSITTLTIANNNQTIDLSPVLEFKELRKLLITNISFEEIPDFSTLKGLKSLIITDCSLDDISFISNLNQLNSISFFKTQVTDLSPLKNLSDLEFLNLRSTSVSDISPVQNLKSLKSLDISDTLVTDLSSIKGLKNLKRLTIFGLKVPKEQIETLATQLPDCRIAFYD